jgi:endonuclease/exonuclease/phosphatase family metal-dependent hydrolase
MFMEQQNPFYLGAKAAIRFKAALVAASSIYWIYRQRVEVQTYAQVNSKVQLRDSRARVLHQYVHTDGKVQLRDGRVRVLQQNCWTPLFGAGPEKEQRMEALVEAAVDYDVLLLQEVFNTWVGGFRVMGYGGWLEDKLRAAGFSHFVSPSPTMLTIQDSGLLIASRFPLRDVFEIVYENWTWPGEAWTSKGALGASVQVPGAPLMAVVVTHLNAWDGPRQQAARHAQMLQMKEQLDQHTRWSDVLIAGDMNVDGLASGKLNPEYASMIVTLQPVLDPANDTTFSTWPSNGLPSGGYPEARYDYILHRSPFRWVLQDEAPVKIGEMSGEGYEGISDHLGMQAVFVPWK